MLTKCIICKTRAAVLPDRDTQSPRKKICRECHTKRLWDDLRIILVDPTKKGQLK